MTLRELTSRHADRLIAAGLGALYCVEIATESHFAGDRAVSFPAAVAFCAALAWRRRAPLVALALAVVIIELSNLAAPALAETGAFLVGFLFAIYSAGRYTRGRALIVGVALVVAAIPLAAIEPGDPVAFTDIAFFVVLFGGPWVVGRYVRHRSERERVLVAERDGARTRPSPRSARGSRASCTTSSPTRSASSSCRRAAGAGCSPTTAETRRALDVIEQAGEQALTEMRRLLGLLRDDEPELSLAPQPSLRRIDDLVAGMRAAGLPVEVVVEGEPRRAAARRRRLGVPDRAGGADQRAQARRARARARDHRATADDALELEIVDDGPGVPSADGAGHGLAGIRERVAIYGGRARRRAARPEAATRCAPGCRSAAR